MKGIVRYVCVRFFKCKHLHVSKVFEEDEREFSSKKRKSSEKDTGDDGDKKSKLDESFAEEIDNPFLRPVKMPRLIKTPGKKAE